MTRVLLVFIDGVGIGGNDAEINPFMRARLDTFAELLGSAAPLVSAEPHRSKHATLLPVDALLGIPGLPQSGTGQTALLTGFNAAAEFGRHFGPWVPTVLRERLAHENILSLGVAAGKSVAFANAYPEELVQGNGERRGRDRAKGMIIDPLRAGPPIAALGAGLLTRHTPQLVRGEAVASEITNDGWRKQLNRSELPIITAGEAGRNLGRIASQHDLTLFAHYSTDYIGHRGHMWESVEALQKIDEFVAGIRAAMSNDVTVAVVSDHGNIEDIRAGHTANPALALFFGQAHEELAHGITALTDVAGGIMRLLGVSTP